MGNVSKWKTILAGLSPGKELDLARHCCRNYATAADLIVFEIRTIAAIMPFSFATVSARVVFTISSIAAGSEAAIHFSIFYFSVIYSHPLEGNYGNPKETPSREF